MMQPTKQESRQCQVQILREKKCHISITVTLQHKCTQDNKNSVKSEYYYSITVTLQTKCSSKKLQNKCSSVVRYSLFYRTNVVRHSLFYRANILHKRNICRILRKCSRTESTIKDKKLKKIEKIKNKKVRVLQ